MRNENDLKDEVGNGNIEKWQSPNRFWRQNSKTCTHNDYENIRVGKKIGINITFIVSLKNTVEFYYY